MSVTIKDCFNLPSLSGGKVIAGEKGLDSIVTAISVLEYDDGYKTGDGFFSHNELLISSFYTLKDDIEAQCQSIRYFKNSGNVGLVLLYTGTILKEVSKELIDTANEIDFPILVFPDNHHQIRFSDIISEVMETVFTEKKHENSLTKNIMKIISSLPEKSRNLDTLLQLISNNKKVSIFLCDEENLLISNGFWPLHTTLDYQFICQYLDQLINVDKIPLIDDNLPIDIYRHPIKIDKSNFSLLVIDQNRTFTKSIFLEIEELISLFTSIYHYNSFFHAKDTLIEALLREDTYLVEKIKKSSKVDMSSIDTLYIIKGKAFNTLPLSHISSKLNDYPVFNAINKGELIILGSKKIINSQCNEMLSELLSTEEFSLYETTISSYKNFAYNYNKIQHAIPYLEKIFKVKNLFSQQDIDFAISIYEIVKKGHDEVGKYLDVTKLLLNEQADNLIETISTYYFDAQSEVKITSQILCVHRNTIQYRFQKSKKILGYDFTNLPYLFSVYTSCALRRYFSN